MVDRLHIARAAGSLSLTGRRCAGLWRPGAAALLLADGGISLRHGSIQLSSRGLSLLSSTARLAVDGFVGGVNRIYSVRVHCLGHKMYSLCYAAFASLYSSKSLKYRPVSISSAVALRDDQRSGFSCTIILTLMS
jgi:hypothetical protein